MPNHFYLSLLANVLIGDRIAERTLVDHLEPIIRRVVRGLAPPDMREDLIQEVWARNCRVLQQFNGGGPFLGFVWVAARNRVRDKLAALPPLAAPIDEVPDIADPDDPELNVEMMQLAKYIERARKRLPPPHQEVIHLRHDLGLKHREIAERLNIPMGTVANRLHHAENGLCNALWETCPDHLGMFGITFGRDE